MGTCWGIAILLPLMILPIGRTTKDENKDKPKAATVKVGRYIVTGPPEAPWKIGYECEIQLDAKRNLIGIIHKPQDSKGKHEAKKSWLLVLRIDRLCWVRFDLQTFNEWEFKARPKIAQHQVQRESDSGDKRMLNGTMYDVVFDYSLTTKKTLMIAGPFWIPLGEFKQSQTGTGFFTISVYVYSEVDLFYIFDGRQFHRQEVSGEKTKSGKGRNGTNWELRWENKRLEKK